MFSGLPAILSAFSARKISFFRDRFFGNFRSAQELRVAGGDMHGDVLGQFRVAAFQVDHDTDAVAVQVGADHVALDAGQAADVDVLAGLGDQGQTSSHVLRPAERRRSASR